MKRVLMLAMVLVAGAFLAQSASAQVFKSKKELEDWFKDKKEMTKLSSILSAPKSFETLDVTFEGRFHKIDDVFTPVYTPFTPKDFINFSVWDTHVRVWQDTITTDFPFLYVRKGVLENATKIVNQMQGMRKYEKLRMEGRVTSVFDGRPYIEVTTICRLEEDEPIAEKALLFMNLAEGETANESYTEAAKLYLQAVDAGLSADLEGICYRRAGELNFKMRNYEHALELLKLAHKRLPDDPGLEDIMAIVKHVIYHEESGVTPPDVADEDIRVRNREMQEQVSTLEYEVNRLREEIDALSNQKIELLQNNGDLEQQLEQLKAQLMTQQEMEALREELRKLKEEKEQ